MWEIAAAISTLFGRDVAELGYDFAVRVAQDRVIEISPEDCDERYLKTLARALPTTAARFLTIPAHEHQPKREVFLQMPTNCATRW